MPFRFESGSPAVSNWGKGEMNINYVNPDSITDATSIESLYADAPLGMRIILLEQLASKILKNAECLMPRLSDSDFNAKMARHEKQVSRASAISEQSTRLFSVMSERNSQAQDLEKLGEVDKATKLYERNVADMFAGTLPYDRLRVLYTRQKLYDAAIRICQSYVDLLGMVEQIWSSYPNISLKPKYIAYIEKLKGKN